MTPFKTITLKNLQDNGYQHLLCGGLKGIEKESLRINSSGLIAQSDHPYNLGSALTHPYITTDYSEALIEFITPPFANISETLDFLQSIHRFVYQHLDKEILLGASMPCGIKNDMDIRIAEYGHSNVGRMKHIYRHGLWHRYGRTMQAIAGIHFNYSVPESLWPKLHQLSNSSLPMDEFIAINYFNLIRNFQRIGWLVLYLFGASPAICRSFFNSKPELRDQFEKFDDHTLYHPYATSLRMSDIGYKSKNQANLKIDYNSLSGYVDSLSKAISTPYSEYEKIGVNVNGEYQQLNSNILQIENEFYSTIRPKQIAMSCEKPTLALKRRGVQYIEMRALDLDLNNPIGIDSNCAYFIEALLLSCLLTESPNVSFEEQQINNSNQLSVAHNGRKPGLLLTKFDKDISLQDWAYDILNAIQPICAILDENAGVNYYQQAFSIQLKRVENPELTLSGQMLNEMTNLSVPFAHFAVTQSEKHADYFRQQPLNHSDNQSFVDLALTSHYKQKELENKEQLPFDEFLHRYFTQTCS